MGQEGNNNKASDQLHLVSVICFVLCTSFWIGAALQLDHFWFILQNALVTLALCFVVERFAVVTTFFKHLQRPYVTLHYGFGLIHSTLYVVTFLVDPNVFAKIWNSALFGYYQWTWIMLVTQPQEFFAMFRMFYTVHHMVGFFLTGSWFLVAQLSCDEDDCPLHLYVLRGIVLWLSSDIWFYSLNFIRSIYPGIKITTIRRLQLIAFVLQRLQRFAGYIQGLVITQGHGSTLEWVVFLSGVFMDILDTSFQANSLRRAFFPKKPEQATVWSDESKDIESNDMDDSNSDINKISTGQRPTGSEYEYES